MMIGGYYLMRFFSTTTTTTYHTCVFLIYLNSLTDLPDLSYYLPYLLPYSPQKVGSHSKYSSIHPS